VNRLVNLEGGGVRLDLNGAHTATHVGVIASVERLNDDAVSGSRNVGVIGGGLDSQVLPRDGVALRDLLEDKSLVGHGVNWDGGI